MGHTFFVRKQTIIFLVLSLALVRTAFARATYQSRYLPDSKEVRITLYDRIPQYDIQTDGDWSRIVVKRPGIPMAQTPDHPQLPEMEYWISVPQGTMLKHVTVTAQAEIRELDLPLMPVQKPYIYKSGVIAPALYADPQIYQADTEYPDTWHTHEFCRMGSTTVLILRIYLFKYTGAEKLLNIFHEPKIQIALEVPHWSSNATPKNIADREIKRKLVNPNEAFFNTPLR